MTLWRPRKMHTKRDTWTHAAFDSELDARNALKVLAQKNLTPDSIEVRSSIPLEGLHPPDLKPHSRVPVMAVLGGIVGGTCAFMLTSLTSQAYPMETGGMPIVPLPTTGVITFEGMAIGAILMTVATVLYEGGLPRFRTKAGPLDYYLSTGQIVVSANVQEGDRRDWTSNAVATEYPDGPGQQA